MQDQDANVASSYAINVHANIPVAEFTHQQQSVYTLRVAYKQWLSDDWYFDPGSATDEQWAEFVAFVAKAIGLDVEFNFVAILNSYRKLAEG